MADALSLGGSRRPHRADLLRCRRCMPFIEDVGERHKLGAGVALGIDVILYGDKTDSERRILDLKVLADFKIIPAEAGEVFHNYRSYLSVLGHGFHFAKRGTVEGRAGVAVVYEELGMQQPVLLGVCL